MKICSDSHDSILRMKSKVALEHVTWETVRLKLKNNASLLVKLILQLVPKHKREDRSTMMALCACISVLLRFNAIKSTRGSPAGAGGGTGRGGLQKCYNPHRLPL